jgi:DNA-binding FadR family transcriptional regulator
VPLKAVESRRLYRQIAEQIRSLINSGEFPVGSRLPSERDLADAMSVSRPSVREALIALEVEGLISINVGSGIYVTARSAPTGENTYTASSDGPFEVLFAREIVEASIASEAAALARPEHISVLDRVLERMESCRGENDKWIELDREFHVSIALVLDNSVLAELVEHLFNKRISRYFERLASYFENESTWSRALAEHRKIRDAIAAKDPDAASKAMRRHLRLSQKRFSGAFGEPTKPPYTAGQDVPAISGRSADLARLRNKPNRRKPA